MTNIQLFHPLNKAFSVVSIFVLWAVSAGLGIVSMLAIREMAMTIYARIILHVTQTTDVSFWTPSPHTRDYWGGVVLGQWLVFLLAILWIAVFIGGAEYHYRHFGEKKSWKLAFGTLGVEGIILILAMII